MTESMFPYLPGLNTFISIVLVAMSVIRMVKLFGWEEKMSTRLDKKREEELQWVWNSRMYNLAINNTKLVSMRFASICVYLSICSFILPMVTMLTTFGTYVGHSVAYVVFSS